MSRLPVVEVPLVCGFDTPAVTPVGAPETANDPVPVNPPLRVTETLVCDDPPCCNEPLVWSRERPIAGVWPDGGGAGSLAEAQAARAARNAARMRLLNSVEWGR